MRSSFLGLLLLVVLVAASITVPLRTKASPAIPTTLAGGVDGMMFFNQPDAGGALQQLDLGQMDVYTGPLRSANQIAAATADQNLQVTTGAGTAFDLFVNPVPVNQTLAPGVFNPFENAEARQALNYLVDREYIVREILGGAGLAHASLWSPISSEAARDPFFFLDQNRNYSYDFTYGASMLFNALNSSGATNNGTGWSWNGNPIVVNLVERIEDQRWHIGQYVAAQFRSLGLQVYQIALTAGSAYTLVYGEPPDTGGWMLYTESWSQPALLAWADGDLQLYACGGEGGAVWTMYTPSAELLDACARLAASRYATLSERETLIEQGSELALNESIRIWLADSECYVYARRVQGVVAGFYGPLWNTLSIRSAHFDTPGGTLKVGQRLLFVSAWQPWRGFGWVYDSVVENTFSDPGLAPHPYTGEYIPVRSSFEVATGGLGESLPVPADAVTYNTTTEVWESVPAGTTAISAVTLNYTFGSWHHGVPMNMNDVLYAVSLILRRDHGDIAARDSDAVNAHDRDFARLFRGLKVVNATALQVFIDSWHIDPTLIAEAADVWPTTPWEVGELAMRTTLHDHTRVSEITAGDEGLYPIDLSKGATITFMDGELQSGNVTTSGAGVTRPPGFDGLIGESEATARWAALEAWRVSYGNYYPSNGPYMLTLVDPVSQQVGVSSFASYPLPADRWNYLETPVVPTLKIDPILLVVPGIPAAIDLTTKVAGAPYSNATVRFRITSSNESVALLGGSAVLVAPGAWQVDLNASFTGALSLGTYQFEAVALGLDASIPIFDNRTFVVAVDTTPPTSTLAAAAPSWRSTAPFALAVTATDNGSGVESVDLYAAYSPDGSSWPSPSLAATETIAPFGFTYTPAQGDGRYRFWTVARDRAGNSESLAEKPATGEVEIGYDTGPPTSALTGPTAYWQRTALISLVAIASDSVSGVASVQLWGSYSADNVTWSAPTLAGSDGSAPYTFSTALKFGDGSYRFWAVAVDASGNVEAMGSKPATGEITVGVDRTAPTVVAFSPENEASGVATSGIEIRVTFSEPVDHAAAEAAFSIAPAVAGRFSWNDNTLVFTPTVDLVAGATYAVTLSATVTDRAGNPLASGYAIRFTTSPGPLVWVFPAGLAAVAIGGAVVIAWWAISRRKH